MNFAGRIEAAVTIASGLSVNATNGSGGPFACTLTGGTYFISDIPGNGTTGLLTMLQAALNAGCPSGWTVSIDTSTGSNAGLVTITGTGSWSIDFSPAADLYSILGFASSSVVAAGGTGTKQCAAVWFPDCPFSLQGDPRQAPTATDARSVVSPVGVVRTLVGNAFLRHRKPTYSHVPVARMWEAQAVTPRASFEAWAKNTQLGQGGFTSLGPGSAVQVYDQNGNLLGSAHAGGPLTGWQFNPGITSIEPTMAFEMFTGFWKLELPDVVSSG